MCKFISNLLLVILIILFPIKLAAQAGELPEKMLVGYWHNFINNAGGMLLRDVPEEYDVINVSFAIPTVMLGHEMTFVPEPALYADQNEFISDISYLHTLGKKVVISVGGATGPINLNNEDEIDIFVSSMNQIITAYGFDGIDIDLEGASLCLEGGDSDFRIPTSTLIVNFISGLSQLLELQSNGFILSMAPEVAYVQGAYFTYAGIYGAYLPVIHAFRDRLSYIMCQHYNTGSMYGPDGVPYAPPSPDFHVAMADALLGGFYVDHYGQNIFFEPLAPHQVLIGLPACTLAAGSGYTEPEDVHTALDYIINGESFGGQYTLSNSNGFPDFRGLMTWSVNWDAYSGNQFAQPHRAYLDSLITTDIETVQNITKENISELSCYPNPFNPATTIEYSVNEPGEVQIEIYNIKGQLVEQLLNENKDAGTYSVVWDGKDSAGNSVGSGVYFCKLKSNKNTETHKLLLMK